MRTFHLKKVYKVRADDIEEALVIANKMPVPDGFEIDKVTL